MTLLVHADAMEWIQAHNPWLSALRVEKCVTEAAYRVTVSDEDPRCFCGGLLKMNDDEAFCEWCDKEWDLDTRAG